MGKDLERELREVGMPPQLASELEALAREIERLPSVEPSSRWSARTKRRLLRRFDKLRRTRPNEPEANSPQ